MKKCKINQQILNNATLNGVIARSPTLNDRTLIKPNADTLPSAILLICRRLMKYH